MHVPGKWISDAVARERRPWPRVLARGVVALCLVSAPAGCSQPGRPDPKETLKGMFEAMRVSDSVTLAANVDLVAVGQDLRSDLRAVATGTVGADTNWGQLLVGQMTGDGELRKRWLTDNQIVLGQTEVSGDSALVEVSFLDRITRVQYYNKMRLCFRNGRWIVTNFRTM